MTVGLMLSVLALIIFAIVWGFGANPSETQRTQLTTLTEGQKKLAGFVKVMDEQQAMQMERLQGDLDRSLTSMKSVSVPPPNESVESRLSEIEATLSEFVSALDGKQLRAAASTLITEVSRNPLGHGLGD